MTRRLFLVGAMACAATGAARAQPVGEPEWRSASSADGTEITYFKLGRGPSLVIAHGGLSAADSWSAVATALADRVTCYVMNRRGSGSSGPHRSGHSLAEEIADIRAVMADAGPRAALLGHSSGAVFALETALRAPVDDLILYEPALAYRKEPLSLTAEQREAQVTARARYRELVAAGNLDDVLVHALGMAGMPGAEVAQLRATPVWAELAARSPAWLGDFEAMAPLSPNVDSFRGLRSRTLLVRGSESWAVLRDTITALDEAIPDSRVLELQGFRHDANFTAPGLLADGIAAFLQPEGA